LPVCVSFSGRFHLPGCFESGSSISHDAAGNPLNNSLGTQTYTYNAANRHATVTENSQIIATYNTKGQRVRKVTLSDDVDFVYDLTGQLIGEYDNGTLIREYMYTDGRLVAVADAAAPNEDPDGDMTDVTVPLRFPGQYADMETGRYYNYFRTYDPSIGRYTQSDPIGLAGGLSRYNYAYDDPVNLSDPYGLYTQDRVIVGDPGANGRCPPGSLAERSMFTGLREICTRPIRQPTPEREEAPVTARCGYLDADCLAGLPRSNSSPERDACILKCLLGLGVESEVQGRVGTFGANEAAKNSSGATKTVAKGVARYLGPVGAAVTVGGLILDPNSCARQCDQCTSP